MKNIFEDEEEQGPGSWIAADKDIVVTPEAPSTVEDAVKALENKDNYGIYLSNIRTGKLTPKDMEEFFGPSSPRAKQKIEKDTGIMFPIKTKTAIDDFIKSRAGKPNLVQYEVVDGTLIFPNSKNNSKGRTQSIVSTVMKNAGVRYTIKQKESFSEAKKETEGGWNKKAIEDFFTFLETTGIKVTYLKFTNTKGTNGEVDMKINRDKYLANFHVNYSNNTYYLVLVRTLDSDLASEDLDIFLQKKKAGRKAKYDSFHNGNAAIISFKEEGETADNIAKKKVDESSEAKIKAIIKEEILKALKK